MQHRGLETRLRARKSPAANLTSAMDSRKQPWLLFYFSKCSCPAFPLANDSMVSSSETEMNKKQGKMRRIERRKRKPSRVATFPLSASKLAALRLCSQLWCCRQKSPTGCTADCRRIRSMASDLIWHFKWKEVALSMLS